MTTDDLCLAAFESLPEPVALLDPDGTVLRANRSMCDFFGLAPEAILGRKCHSLFHGADDFVDCCPLVAARSSGRRETLEMEAFGRSFLVVVDPVRSPDVPISCFLHSPRDITGRKAAERAVLDSGERFKAAFEHASIGRALTLPDGRLGSVNAKLCEMLGYTKDELQGKTFADITHPDDLEKSRECARMLLSGGKRSHRMEKRYLRKEGRAVWTEVSTVLIRDGAGNPLNFITDIIDITDRKRSEREIKEQIDELRRWQKVVIGREERVIELKREVNEALAKAGLQARYEV